MRGVAVRDRTRLSGRDFTWSCLWDLVTISGYFMLAWIGTTSSHSSLIISPISTPVPVIGCSWSVEASAEGVSGVSLLKQTPSKKQKAAALRDGGGGGITAAPRPSTVQDVQESLNTKSSLIPNESNEICFILRTWNHNPNVKFNNGTSSTDSSVSPVALCVQATVLFVG